MANPYQTLVELILRAKDEYSKEMKAYSGAARKAASDTDTLTASGDRAGVAFSKINASIKGFAASTLTIGAGVAALKNVLAEGAKVERQQLRLASLVKATGGAAGLTAKELDQMARALGENTLASTDAARDAISVLLTFKSISGDTFERTLKLSQDLAEVFGGDLRGKATQLAKALEDPVKGLESLRESGVSFTEQEREQIKALVEANQLLEAQGVILDKVSSQVGGAAAAAGQGLTGQLDLLKQRYDEYNEAVSRTREASLLTKGLAATIDFLTDRIKASKQAGLPVILAFAPQNWELMNRIAEKNREIAEQEEEASKRAARIQGERTRLTDQLAREEAKLAELQKASAEEFVKSEKAKFEARVEYAQRGVDALKKSIEEAQQKEREYAEQVKTLTQQQADARQSTSDRVRELRRRDMDDTARQADIAREAETKLAQATVGFFEGADPQKTREAAQAVQDLAARLQDTGKAVSITERAGSIISRTFEQQKEAAAANAKGQVDAQAALKQALSAAQDELEGYKQKLAELTETPKAVQLQTDITQAEAGIAKLKGQLDALPTSKTITIETSTANGTAAPGFATGGQLSGYGGGDRVHALLEAGEYVIRKEAVRRYGSAFLHAVNSMSAPLRLPAVGSVPRFATGGMVGAGGAPLTLVLDGKSFQANTTPGTQRDLRWQARKRGGRK